MPKSIPERWLEYKPYGTVIKGTKILPFKVPLKEVISNNIESASRFTTTSLLNAFPRVKYIVDLTNTGRYYDEKEFTDFGVKYVKIMVRGREIPTMDVINTFFKTMDDFTSACGEEDIIGVHCTHGVNRSGYLICRYLIQQLGWEFENTLKAFEEARGYPIERENYINALMKTPREKIDTSKIKPSKLLGAPNKMRSSYRLGLRHSVGPIGFIPPRRGFAKDGPFSSPPPPPPRHFGFGGPPPPFRHVPPPPGMPPMAGPPPMFGPRPFRYGPPPRAAMPPPPPRPGFSVATFPPSPMPPTRLPHVPPARLPPPKMPPPPPPQSVSRGIALKRLQTQKRKSQMRNGNATPVRSSTLIRQNSQTLRRIPKLVKEQDFTVDTFEENLLAVSGQPNRRPPKAKFSQSK